MAAVSQIPMPAPLKTSSNLAVEWKRFKGQWINYSKAAKINREEKDCQAAIFLACIGTDAYNIFTTMEFAEEGEKADPEKLIEAFEKHCIGEVNEVYERYVFNRRQQKPGESFDTFVGDLRRLVKSCNCGRVEDSTVRDRIVLGIRDDATRKKLLQTRKLDLARVIDICRSAEVTTRHLKTMTSPDEVHALRQQSRAPRTRTKSRHRRESSRLRNDSSQSPSADMRDKSSRRCRYCNQTHARSKQSCPAYGQVCTKCSKRNHFAVVCQSKSNNTCEYLTEESLLSLDGVVDKRCYSHVIVDGRRVKFLLDCGSTVNLLPSSILPSIGKRTSDLRPPRSSLRMFDRTELRTVGMLTADLTHPRTKTVISVEFYVTEREEPILGIDACRRLDMLRIVEENICEVVETSPSSRHTSARQPTADRITESDVFDRFGDLFDGKLGLLEGEVHLEIDPNVAPVKMPLRRIPVAMRDRVEAELRKMVDDDVIAPVSRPTPWVSALLVVAKQDGGIRICIDPKPLNKALQMADLKMVASADTIKKITIAAKEDDEYGCLMRQIETGWPDTVETLPTCLRPYHTFADELSVSCGLIFKGHRFVVPLPVRPYFLKRLHSAHIGVNGCLRRARETVYWPGITTAIKRIAEECAICARYQQSNQKEPLKSHPAPSRPFEKVGVDIFTFENQDYLMTVDYLSGFFEVDRLPSKAVSNNVYCLRQHFSRHGLPLEVVSDNSPFASAEFRRFAERFDFIHTTSSPHYSQSNGRVERAIQVIKRLLRKCRETNEDPLLALLEWRNCPSEQLSPYSPNQIVFGRRTRTLLPTADKLLDTATSAAASTSLAKAKMKQAEYYNRNARERPSIPVGQTVRVRFDDRPDWRKGEIAKVLPHRSYEVKFEDGTVRRRTSRHVRFSDEKPIIIDDEDSNGAAPPVAQPPVAQPATACDPGHNTNNNPTAGTSERLLPNMTRSGRIVRRPSRYND